MRRKAVKILALVLLIGICIIAFNVYMSMLHDMPSDHLYLQRDSQISVGRGEKRVKERPIAVIHAERSTLESGYLNQVFDVFKRIGYEQGNPESDWDVMWSHHYPFSDPELTTYLRNMKPHQKINHWPGSGCITVKWALATSDLHFIPKAFDMPSSIDSLKEYSKENPGKLWVQKNKNHRGIGIRPLAQLDMTGESFVQEYVDKPLLIDGRRFDFGVYIAVTSINPLRVYMYEEETNFRYCTKVYHPFDPDDVDKYVIRGDGAMQTWEMPSLKETYSRLQYSHKETFNHYVRSIGKDPSVVWRNVKASVMELFLSKEPHLLETLHSEYRSGRNFFELVRFDFVVDEDLNVFLMEVNMSPDLGGDPHPKKVMKVQVLFNVLSLVGVAGVMPASLEESSETQNNMLVSDRDIQTYSDLCNSETCLSEASCSNLVCQLCEHCLTADWREHLKAAFMEHVSRRNFRRVCPVPLTQEEAAHTKLQSESDLSESNWLMDYWYRGKCLQDPAWCT